MKTSILAAAAVLVMVSATDAFAKEDIGKITKIDKSGDSITLSDGKTFTLPEGIEAESLKVGERVRVVFSTNAAGKTIVSSVVLVK